MITTTARPARRILALAMLSLALLGCPLATPPADDNTTARAPAAASPPSQHPAPALPAATTKPAPRKSDPMPPQEVPATGLPASITVDSSCSASSDCAVKNVGNCCGVYPACVNKNSPTDPAAVKAQCAQEGRMSVCGFQEIASCSCQQGRCVPDASSADPSAPVDR